MKKDLKIILKNIMKDEVKTRLIYETNDDRLIWESPYSDVCIEDILEALYGILVGATWHPQTIMKGFKDFLEEHEFEDDKTQDNGPHFYA
jgi:hypothetical protein